LVTHHPLVWNIRLVWAVAGLAVLHLLFFIMGFMALDSIRQLTDYRYRNMENTAGVILFSMLSSLFFIICWLLYYFRHNPLKSIYPVNAFYLIKEFLLVVIICFMAVTFPLTYKLGSNQKIKALTDKNKYIEYANAHNLSFYFIPYEDKSSLFLPINNCDRQKKEEDLKKSSHSYEDDERMLSDIDNPEEILSGTQSYLNYCRNDIDDKRNLRSQYQNHAIAKRWMMNKNLDSIRLFLTQYHKIVENIGMVHIVNIDTLVNAFQNNPRYEVKRFYNYYPHYPEVNEYDYSNKNDLSNLLTRMENAHNTETIIYSGGLLFYVFATFILALFIISFRLTKLRSFVIALLSILLWGILTGMYFAFNKSADNHEYLFVFYFCLFGFLSIFMIYTQANKTLGAVFLNLFTWSLIYIIPLIYQTLLHNARRGHSYMEGEQQNPKAFNSYQFYKEYQDLSFVISFVFIILMVSFVIIPLAKKWQANPE